MTSKLTRERLQEIAEDGFLKHGESKELARTVLAAMDSEPVAYTEKHEISNMHATGLYLRAWPADRARNAVEGYTIPLYTTPQPISLVNSEPVAYIFKHPAGKLFWALTDESNKGQNDVMPVYASPQPAPVVPDDLLSMAASAIEDLLEHTDPNTSYYSGVWADVPGKLRAAMLQAEPVTTANKLGNSPAIPDSARDALEKALAAMEFMGDTLNNLDAVCTEDVELVAPAFDAVRNVLAAAQQEGK